MKDKRDFNAGDVAVSIAGRDKGGRFLVVKVDKNYAFITDGRTHKVNKLKKKKFIHLEPAESGKLTDIALRIERGECVGDNTVHKSLSK